MSEQAVAPVTFNRLVRVKVTEEWKEERPNDNYPRSCERTLLLQDVDAETFDLRQVIAAVNGLLIAPAVRK